jgi:N-acetylglucosamine kinase-like BadF-type ATPase
MLYIIGIDGGGSKTTCAISKLPDDNQIKNNELTYLQDRLVYQCTGNASNILTIGLEKAAMNIYKLIEEAVTVANPGFYKVDSIFIGAAGAGRKRDAESLKKSLEELFKEKKLIAKKIRVDGDARIALEGAFSGRPGCILISGTGSIMFGKDDKENIFRTGGFGRYIGDEGSGYSLGRKALIAASKELDSRGEKTIITKLLKEELGIGNSEELIFKVYRDNLNFASISKLLLTAADYNDSVALKIINEETDELINHIKTMIQKMNNAVTDLAFIGSIIENKNIFSDTLTNKINLQFPEIVIKQPEYPSVIGALIMAEKILDKKT